MDSIFRLLAPSGESYRIAEDDFLKLQAWLAVKRRLVLSEISRNREGTKQRNDRIEQLRDLLEYNKLVRAAEPAVAGVKPSASAEAVPNDRDSDVAVGSVRESSDPILEFVPGGFRYGGVLVPLKGKPLQLLQLAAESHHRTVTRAAAEQRIWNESPVTPNAINKTASKVRHALRIACQDEDLDTFQAVDRGKNVAWRITIPFRLPDRADSRSIPS
jgi:hypothetical protein